MSQTTDAVIAELMDRRLLNDVDDSLHQEIAEAIIKAAQPVVDDDEPLTTRDLAMIDQAWENHKSALPVATVINDNQLGRTAIIEITIDPPTLPVGTKLYAEPGMVELPEAAPAGEVAWQWRCSANGVWSDWEIIKYPIEQWRESFAGQVERGTVECRPLYATPPAITEREKVATKKTYIKPLRTIVEIDERYADQIRDLLNAALDGGDHE